jgi:hypothetical protein
LLPFRAALCTVFVVRHDMANGVVLGKYSGVDGETQAAYFTFGQVAVTVEMKPEEAGFFSKTAAVHCNAKGSPIRLTVSGTASSR